MNRWEQRELIKKGYQKDESGKYRYVGRWYVLTQWDSRWQRCRLWCLLQVALTLALGIGMGFVPSGSMIGTRTESFNYVILLYAAVLLLSAVTAYYGWMVCWGRFCLREFDSNYAERHSDFSAGTALGAGILALAQGIFTASAGTAEDLLWDLLLTAMALALGVVNAVAWRKLRKLGWIMRDTKPSGIQ